MSGPLSNPFMFKSAAAAAGLTISTANNDYDVVPYIVKADNSVLLGAPQLNFG
jgi:hypothetical protein